MTYIDIFVNCCYLKNFIKFIRNFFYTNINQCICLRYCFYRPSLFCINVIIEKIFLKKFSLYQWVFIGKNFFQNSSLQIFYLKIYNKSSKNISLWEKLISILCGRYKTEQSDKVIFCYFWREVLEVVVRITHLRIAGNITMSKIWSQTITSIESYRALRPKIQTDVRAYLNRHVP